MFRIIKKSLKIGVVTGRYQKLIGLLYQCP